MIGPGFDGQPMFAICSAGTEKSRVNSNQGYIVVDRFGERLYLCIVEVLADV